MALDACVQNLHLGILPTVETPLLDPDHIQDAFIIHTLLLDAIRRGPEIRQDNPITAPHEETVQKDRYIHLMKDYSHRNSSFLRPESNHACNGCAEEVVRADGSRGMSFRI